MRAEELLVCSVKANQFSNLSLIGHLWFYVCSVKDLINCSLLLLYAAPLYFVLKYFSVVSAASKQAYHNLACSQYNVQCNNEMMFQWSLENEIQTFAIGYCILLQNTYRNNYPNSRINELLTFHPEFVERPNIHYMWSMELFDHKNMSHGGKSIIEPMGL